MDNMSHVILGLSVKTFEMIDSLKKQGKKEIYVIDYEQSDKVRERNGVVYFSPRGALMFTKSTLNITYHHYMYITPKSIRNKRKKDED